MSDVCQFIRDHVAECSEGTVLFMLHRLRRYFSYPLAKRDGWSADFMHWCCTCVETVLACDWLFVSSFSLDDMFTSNPSSSFSVGNPMCGSLYDIPLMCLLLLSE